MPKKRYSRQQIKKLSDKKCFFCPVDDYHVLNSHRILPGEEGGKYHEWNMLTVCANCHNRIHAGEIKIDRKYTSSYGSLVVHYWKDGQEFWEPEHR